LELLVIRHGESEADLLGVHEGRADFPLTAHGEEQAGKMAAYVEEHYPPDIILASPLKRARKTAQFLKEKIGCGLVELPNLMEFNNGVLAGLPREEAAIRYPLPEGGRPMHIPIQDGESELEFRYRAECVFHKIIYEYREYNRVAIVSHGGFISHFIKVFLHLPVTSEAVFATGDTGIHLLEIRENKRVVRFLNKQEHLR
jgi:2,3-bisphosphoglycerate-dependent phosphoglycerate mutase